MTMRNFVLTFILITSIAGPALAADFILRSDELTEGGTLDQANVYNGNGCDGGNQSPALSWSGEPAGTRSFAVTMFDPDARAGTGWWHWALFNLPAKSHTLAHDAGNSETHQLPAGAVQVSNDFKAQGYGGACPPPGDPPHRYVFTVYALDTDTLPLGADASPAAVEAAAKGAALATATLTGKYGR